MPYVRCGKCVYKGKTCESKGKKMGCSDSIPKAKEYLKTLRWRSAHESREITEIRRLVRAVLLIENDSQPNLASYADRLWDVIIDVLNSDDIKSRVRDMPLDQELSIVGVEGEIFSNYENINQVNLHIAVNELNDKSGVQVQAHYACNVEDRSKSDLILGLYIPREYSDIPEFERWLEFDLADALSHELQHSCDTTEMLSADIPEGEEKWISIDHIYRHFGSDAETRGYVAGILGRGRRMEMRGHSVDYNQLLTNDLVGRVFDQALLRGYSEEEMYPVMNSIATKWDQRMTDILKKIGAVDDDPGELSPEEAEKLEQLVDKAVDDALDDE